MIGVDVNRSHGVNGNVARANVVALSTSTIAAPPEPSAYPQKPWNSKPSGGFHCAKKARFRRAAASLVSTNSHVTRNRTATSFEMVIRTDLIAASDPAEFGSLSAAP